MLTFMALEEQAARASVNPWQMTMMLSVDNRGPSLDLDLVCKATKTNHHLAAPELEAEPRLPRRASAQSLSGCVRRWYWFAYAFHTPPLAVHVILLGGCGFP